MEYISQCVTPRVTSEHIVKFTVPSGGLVPGSVVQAISLDSGIAGNYEVYSATTPATALLNDDRIAIIINDGYETLSDGRRPAGQPDYYQYTFAEGETVTGIFLDKHLVFDIGSDCVTIPNGTTPAAGYYLYPTNGATKLTVGSSLPEGQTKALKILTIKSQPIGGLFGGKFATTYVCVAI